MNSGGSVSCRKWLTECPPPMSAMTRTSSRSERSTRTGLGGGLQRVQVRQHLAREAIGGVGRLRFGDVTEDRPDDQIRARAHGRLPLQLLAHVRRGAGDGEPTLPRLVEIAREANGRRAEIAPELGEVGVQRRV